MPPLYNPPSGTGTSSVASQYTQPTAAGPLDGMSANGAWSVAERLYSTYAGPLFTVRRGSDNATLDVYPLASTGKCDEASLTAFCGSSSGYVTTLYDQSGNGRSLTQSTAGNQPTVYASSTIQKDGTSVALLFAGTQSLGRADAAGISGSQALTLLAQHNFASSATADRMLALIGPATSGADIEFVYNSGLNMQSNAQAIVRYTGTASGPTYTIWQHASGAALGGWTLRQNGAVCTYASTPYGSPGYVPSVSNTQMTVGGSPSGATLPCGSLSTLALAPATLSSQQLANLEAWLEARRTGAVWAPRAVQTSTLLAEIAALLPLAPFDALPTPAAAWSVAERLLSSYAGPLFTVRRGSDNATLDVYPLASTGKCDEASLTAFCGSSSGYVTTLYDQSGNVRNLTQSTAAYQPAVVASGVVYKDAGNVSMLFASTQLNRADACGFAGDPTLTFVALHNFAASTDASRVLFSLGAFSSGVDYELVWGTGLQVQSNSQAVVRYAGSASGPTHTVWQRAPGANVSNWAIRQNGQPQAYAAVTFGNGSFVPTLSDSYTGLGNGPSRVDSCGTISTAALVSGSLTVAQLATIETWLEARRSGAVWLPLSAAPVAAGLLSAKDKVRLDRAIGMPLDGLPAVGAWSVAERLYSSYGGPLFTVRRASDNATRDIYPLASGLCDETVLASFCSGTSGYVTTVYDQSGNGRSLTQSTAGNQPYVVGSGVVQKDGGLVTMVCATAGVYVSRNNLSLSGSPSFSVITAHTFSRGSTYYRIVWWIGAFAAGQNVQFGLDNDSANNLTLGIYYVGTSRYGAAATGPTYAVVQCTAGQSINAASVRQNGTQRPLTDTATGTTVPNIVDSLFGLGGMSGSVSGSVSTCAVLPYTLNTTQLASVEAWLEARRLNVGSW